MIDVTLDYSYKHGEYEVHFGFSYKDPDSGIRIACNKYRLTPTEYALTSSVIRNEKIMMLNNIVRAIEDTVKKIEAYKEIGIDNISSTMIRKIFDYYCEEKCILELPIPTYKIDTIIENLTEIKNVILKHVKKEEGNNNMD